MRCAPTITPNPAAHRKAKLMTNFSLDYGTGTTKSNLSFPEILPRTAWANKDGQSSGGSDNSKGHSDGTGG